MTAGIDLALAIVEKDVGAEVARSVAQKLVVYHLRNRTESLRVSQSLTGGRF